MVVLLYLPMWKKTSDQPIGSVHQFACCVNLQVYDDICWTDLPHFLPNLCFWIFFIFFKKKPQKKINELFGRHCIPLFPFVPIHEVDYLIPEFYIFFRSAVSFQRRNLPYCVFLRVLSSCCAIHHFTNIIMSLETKNPTSPYCWLLCFSVTHKCFWSRRATNNKIIWIFFI